MNGGAAVAPLAIDQHMTMTDQLACCPDRRRKPGTVDDIIQPPFQQLQQFALRQADLETQIPQQPRAAGEWERIVLVWSTVTGSRLLCRLPWFLAYLERLTAAGMRIPSSVPM